MTDHKLENCRVAILATNGFEQSELFDPKHALERAGAHVDIVSLESGTIKAWEKQDWGRNIDVSVTVNNAKPEDYDALMLPGGVMNPDKLRANANAVNFVRSFVQSGKPIAAICHGPWTLIEAHGVQGRKMTSWPSIKTDLINAGAQWVDSEVVVDHGLVTSRMPQDIPAFCEKMIEEFAEGMHKVPQNVQGLKTQRQNSLH